MGKGESLDVQLTCRQSALAIAGLAVAGLRRRRQAASSGGGGDGGGGKLTIYSSLPLQGAARTQSEAAVNGAKLALEQAGGKVVDLGQSSTSRSTTSTAQQGGWEPGVTSANALKVAGDDSAVGYIGEFNSGATAKVDLLKFNQAGIVAGQPGQHRGRHHHRRSRLRAR